MTTRLADQIRPDVFAYIDRNPGKTFAQIMVALNVEQHLFREVDRALQSLRRKGLVTYSRKGGWFATKEAE